MAKSLVEQRDVRFVLFEQLEVQKFIPPDLAKEYDLETLEMVIGEAEKLARNVVALTNKDGDRLGCRFEAGKVILPDSFKKAYDKVREGGWNIISDPVEVGGQGLPKSIEICCREWFEAANMSFSNYLNLTHGAGKLIEIYGTPEQKKLFLDNLYSGTWCGTMCLTEPEAGSDIGGMKTIAKRNQDGTYSIKGTKIFITAGEHNLAENIVHMVLARIKGDPPGTKGLSVFIVPKYRVKEGGGIGGPNDVVCTGIEEKLGSHGSSTCTLNFGDEDNCIGYLLGKEREGIKVMFHMMNEARQLVGSQALAVASAAYLEALSYAKERIQGVHFSRVRDPQAPKVPIIEHPDIRYTLLKMKAYVEGCRALLYYHAHCMDRMKLASSEEESLRWKSLIELLTPVCKAYCSDLGFKICSAAIQVLGGYGYSREFPVEQYLRDVRVTSIYEGTNGIQAIDLVGRKIRMNDGQALRFFLDEIDNVLNQGRKRENFSRHVSLLEKYKGVLEEGAQSICDEMRSPNVGLALAKASKFLELFGDITLASLWLWQSTIAEEKLETFLEQKGMALGDFDMRSCQDKEGAYYAGKIHTGKFYLERVMPAVFGKLEEIKSEGENFLEMPVDCL